MSEPGKVRECVCAGCGHEFYTRYPSERYVCEACIELLRATLKLIKERK